MAFIKKKNEHNVKTVYKKISNTIKCNKIAKVKMFYEKNKFCSLFTLDNEEKIILG